MEGDAMSGYSFKDVGELGMVITILIWFSFFLVRLSEIHPYTFLIFLVHMATACLLFVVTRTSPALRSEEESVVRGSE
jgi:hypothetical protein